ncbi:hypothetical protein BHK69_22595 [Bosea vaviloviae]|uniref:Uncharacterized protein n=1 Tax=Bosea vaviloviae TaxID=1526658 RepID=A0A1D7U648_9HYPH|nr:hypothetical protein BHK69_22595 [Bosea vaviloviae]
MLSWLLGTAEDDHIALWSGFANYPASKLVPGHIGPTHFSARINVRRLDRFPDEEGILTQPCSSGRISVLASMTWATAKRTLKASAMGQEPTFPSRCRTLRQ